MISYQRFLLPQTHGQQVELAFQIGQEQLRAGEVDFLRVFTARTSLLQLRRAHLDALNELAQAAANLTAVTGLPPDALLAEQPGSAVASARAR